MKIVLKLGGFLFPGKLNSDLINDYIKLLKKLYSDDHRLIVVTGGGAGAREYIGIARKGGVSEAICDEIGIEFTRLNARLLISLLQHLSLYYYFLILTEKNKKTVMFVD